MVRPSEAEANSVRPALPGDLHQITDCAKAAYSLYLPRMDRPPAPMLADYAALIESGETWSLLHGGEVAGFLVMMIKADHLFVENVAIHPDHQGAGLGKKLMSFAEGYGRARDLPRVELYTNVVMTENVAFYRRLGFIGTETRQEDGYQRIYFAKDLEAAGD